MITCSDIVFDEEKHIISIYTSIQYKNLYYTYTEVLDTYLQTQNKERG